MITDCIESVDKKHFYIQDGVNQNKTLEAYVCSNCKIKLDGNFEPITQRPKNREKELYFISSLNTLLYYDTKKEFN